MRETGGGVLNVIKPTVSACALCASIAGLFLFSGCRLFGVGQPAEPMSYRQQAAQLREWVPEGTPRDEAVQRLTAAGVEGEFSRVGDSIYYCNFRKNPETGRRRQMTIALLFDHAGRFYATQPAEGAPGGSSGDASTPASSAGRFGPAASAAGNRQHAPQPSSVFPNEQDRAPARPKRRGDELRTPFYGSGGG